MRIALGAHPKRQTLVYVFVCRLSFTSDIHTHTRTQRRTIV